MRIGASLIGCALVVGSALAGCNAVFGLREPSGDSDATIAPADASIDVPQTSDPITDIVAGGDSTCYLRSSGSVRCWGRNDAGQLGYGTRTNVMDPATVGDVLLTGVVVQLAAGTSHICARFVEGKAVCWGAGGAGRLGQGDIASLGDDETLEAQVPIALSDSVAGVTAGGSHTCARLTNDKVACWGNGANGRLGYGNTEDVGDDEPPRTAGVVNGELASDLAAGSRHTCVVSPRGIVRCWGNGAAGRLGNAGVGDVGDTATTLPTDVVLGMVAAQVVAGSEHSCARSAAGEVRCWGEGSRGALGYGRTNSVGDDEAPMSAGVVEVGGAVRKLAAGAAHTCALLTNGSVTCWGSNPRGQLGYGDLVTIGDDETPASKGSVALGEPARDLAAGANHTCALLVSGTVRCWGAGESGQLGNGGTADLGDDELPTAGPPIGP